MNWLFVLVWENEEEELRKPLKQSRVVSHYIIEQALMSLGSELSPHFRSEIWLGHDSWSHTCTSKLLGLDRTILTLDGQDRQNIGTEIEIQ